MKSVKSSNRFKRSRQESRSSKNLVMNLIQRNQNNQKSASVSNQLWSRKRNTSVQWWWKRHVNCEKIGWVSLMVSGFPTIGIFVRSVGSIKLCLTPMDIVSFSIIRGKTIRRGLTPSYPLILLRWSIMEKIRLLLLSILTLLRTSGLKSTWRPTESLKFRFFQTSESRPSSLLIPTFILWRQMPKILKRSLPTQRKNSLRLATKWISRPIKL